MCVPDQFTNLLYNCPLNDQDEAKQNNVEDKIVKGNLMPSIYQVKQLKVLYCGMYNHLIQKHSLKSIKPKNCYFTQTLPFVNPISQTTITNDIINIILFTLLISGRDNHQTYGYHFLYTLLVACSTIKEMNSLVYVVKNKSPRVQIEINIFYVLWFLKPKQSQILIFYTLARKLIHKTAP